MEKVVFVPSCLPPHKDDADLVSSEDRLDMISLAIDENPFFDVSDVEIRREGMSYSIETLKELIRFYGQGVILSFIVGIDAFLEITTWKDYNNLFDLSNFIITGRPGYNPQQLGEILPPEVSESIFCDDKDGYHMLTQSRKDSAEFSIVYLETTQLDISSSVLRKRIKEEKTIKYLVPPEIEDYIKVHRLYR